MKTAKSTRTGKNQKQTQNRNFIASQNYEHYGLYGDQQPKMIANTLGSVQISDREDNSQVINKVSKSIDVGNNNKQKKVSNWVNSMGSQ